MHKTPENFREICQDRLPLSPWMEPGTARLPGVNPLEIRDWLLVDEVFAAQMAYRDWLLANRRAEVLTSQTGSDASSEELLDLVVEHLSRQGPYRVGKNSIRRPDGVEVPLNGRDRLMTAARLVQEDFCILEKGQEEHVLVAAALCFPASWNLAEKIGLPLAAIHQPVVQYDEIRIRVQRMFDLMAPARPLWRANFLIYSNPDLFQPRQETDRRRLEGDQRWIRVERQTLRKMRKSGSIVFGIHTYCVPFANLTAQQRNSLPAKEPVQRMG